ncbi:MAG: hypothetical protein JKY31_04245 [Rhodobacteraceae bacterium]|nr:hypothetical protein [Paracoccaceae bacterium]
MTPEQALEYGLIAAGPILLFVGGFFALAISASPFYHLLGKAVAWPLSPVVGLVLGAYLGNAYLPNWEDWGVAWFFGVGFFLTWMIFGLLSHDDLTHHYGDWMRSLGKALSRKFQRRVGISAPSGKTYRARAASRSDGDHR